MMARRPPARLRRWGVALIIPPATVPGRGGRIVHVMARHRSRRAATADLPRVEGLPEVDRAALDLGAWCDVVRLDRHGCVRRRRNATPRR